MCMECLMKWVTLISVSFAAMLIVVLLAPKNPFALRQAPQATTPQPPPPGQENPPDGAQVGNTGRGNAGARPTPPPPPPAVMPTPVTPIVSMTAPNPDP